METIIFFSVLLFAFCFFVGTRKVDKPTSTIKLQNVCAGETTVSLNSMNFLLKGNQVYVNGVPWGPLDEASVTTENKVVLGQDGVIQGPIQGDLVIQGSVPVTLIVNGDVEGSILVQNGDIQCGHVGLGVTAQGNVKCGNVAAGIHAGGDVTCTSA